MLFSRLPSDQVTDGERRTFRIHLTYSLIEGAILGVLALNEYVFLRSLNGSNYLMSVLFQSSMVVFLFLILFNEFISRARNHGKLLRITGLLTRGPLILLVLFPSDIGQLTTGHFYHYAFIGIFLIYYLGNPVIYPTISLLLKNNYSHHNFGRFYSLAQSAGKALMMVVTLVYGILLDINPFAFKWVFPVIAFTGIASLWLLSGIKLPEPPPMQASQGFLKSIRRSAMRMKEILTRDTPFRHFQIGMMFYGFSYMISVTTINIFFREHLNLNYTSVAFYKNFYNIEAIMLLPWFGRLIGRIDPRTFGIITFASLLAYVLLLMVTGAWPWKINIGSVQIYYFLTAAFLVYGFYAATMALLWNIGSVYFCTPLQSADYQGVHLFLTAVRALFAPLMGVWIYEQFGFNITFLLTAISLGIAIAILAISYFTTKTTTTSPGFQGNASDESLVK